ncbi:hypothetical protein Misp04_48220 [Micromonospora sp. NBRC 101691]|nr:hypothetical protein Misp04_48220 [Micromonospora sp. NBRC 101691]
MVRTAGLTVARSPPNASTEVADTYRGAAAWAGAAIVTTVAAATSTAARRRRRAEAAGRDDTLVVCMVRLPRHRPWICPASAAGPAAHRT